MSQTETFIMNKQQGFVLIELIAVIVLVGIIASFSTFFLFTGFNGYIKSKNATEGALNAQMALDRISHELRSISDIIPTPSSTSITYKSEVLTGTRTLKYVGNEVLINVNTNDNKLLENISSFTLSYAMRDLDHDLASDDEVPGGSAKDAVQFVYWADRNPIDIPCRPNGDPVFSTASYDDNRHALASPPPPPINERKLFLTDSELDLTPSNN
jgi:prepilin-type N-terminal cleavage/methylation domain-containing protein